MNTTFKRFYLLSAISLFVITAYPSQSYAEQCPDENVPHTHDNDWEWERDNCDNHTGTPTIDIYADPINEPTLHPFFLPAHPGDHNLHGTIDTYDYSQEELDKKREQCKKDAKIAQLLCENKAAQDYLADTKQCERWSQGGVLLGAAGAGGAIAARRHGKRSFILGGFGGILAARAAQCANTTTAERDLHISDCQLAQISHNDFCNSF